MDASLQALENRWHDADADALDPVERLVYRSNLLGSDQRITNTGGGNTSSKITAPDPLFGQDAEVLFVKGSGGDLRTSTRANFASLYLEKLLALRDMYDANPDKGLKTPLEDKMVSMYPHAVYNLNPRASSIDTPLHGFVPHRFVDHTHPQAVIAIAACKDQERLTKEIYGDEVAWVPWQRPGFELGLTMQRVCESKDIKGIVMGQHGLINWADDDKACYELSLALINKAAAYLAEHDQGEAAFGGARCESLDEDARHALLVDILPTLRGMVSQQNKFIATVHADEMTLQFVNSVDAPRLAELGTSCPDHFLRTKIKPLYVDWQPQQEGVDVLLEKLEQGLSQYRADYQTYYHTCKRPDSPTMRDPNPTVVLIPGVGLIAFGKNKSESRVTAEFYRAAISVMRGAESVSQYQALPQQEAFDIEYWALEEAKLQRMPPEKAFARQVVVVVGAGNGIGKAVAARVAREGAHVVCADLDEAAAKQTAQQLTDTYGVGIGVAGTGISGCGPAIGVGVDITQRESINAMFAHITLAYGGIDSVIVTAGIFASPDADGNVPDAMWRTTFEVNVTGSYLIADEAARIWHKQNLPGSLVLTTSANAVVAKKGSFAYDTSKAAANHLVRELAIELAPLVRVNGLAPATVVEGSTMFPRERVISSLKKYDIAFADDETTDALRDKLAQFYAGRTLTKAPITLADQAEAAYLLASDALSKTTGQVLAVDGGLVDAMLR
jgi:rhamnulose-1-phosphate aldolase/alcohol dehydrogenase